MKHSQSEKDKMKALSDLGFSSREIAKIVLGSESKKSSVNNILNSGIVNKTTSDVGGTHEDNSRILFISDLHIPYHHPDSFAFLQHLKDKYKPTRVISLGDECFEPSVEVLTEEGFIPFSELADQKVAQWNEDWTVDYVEPTRKVEKEYNGDLIEFSQKAMTIRCTPKHNLVKIHPVKGTVHRREAWDFAGTSQWEIPRFGCQSGEGVDLTDNEIRLMVAFQADGTFTKGAARFSFQKERKEIRLKSLLEACKVPYNVHNVKRDRFQAYIEKDNVPAYFTKEFSIPVKDFTLAQKTVFVEELEFWDGTAASHHVRYSCVVKKNVEYAQMMAITAGYTCSKLGSHNCWYIDFRKRKEKTSLNTARVKMIPYTGKVYCVTVPSGMIVVRIDGHIVITGNCDKHALSYHDSDPDLYSAGHELIETQKYMKELEKMFPCMDIVDSNHGSLVWRKAKTNGIPKHYIKSYNDVLGIGKGWKWQEDLTVELPNGQSVYVHHGKAADGLKLSQTSSMNCAQGHYHEKFNIQWWANSLGLYWSMQCGCLIDSKSYAFQYANVNLRKQLIGTGLVINSIPLLEPMILLPSGRWKGPE